MRYFIIPILLLVTLMPCAGQEDRNADWYVREAEEAVESERYEYAVQILMEGREAYPETPVFSRMLGDLYYDKELYSLALKEYNKARELAPEDFDILYAVATTQGMLNRDFDSAETLEEILRLYPDSLDVIIDLGWMYFKTFQLAKGEELLSEALETYGTVPGLSMTLGTIYSGMYEYEKAKKNYLDSINAALDAGRKYFASVAYYNLSLLEQSFYRFNDALEATRHSLQMAERAPGHIALGELYQLKAGYEHAKTEYEKAFSIDTTPLAMMNLADLHSEFGHPDRALAYLEEVRQAEDTSWMYYFGTDMKRHRLELHRIYEDIYRALASKSVRTPGRGFERLAGLFRGITFRALSWYHARRYKALCLDVGLSYLEDGNVLDANWFFYKGNSDYQEVALKYLARAEDFETAMAPEAGPYYLLEQGRILSDISLLSEAVEGLEDEWEKSALVEALSCLAPLVYRRNPPDAAVLFRNLYRLNRGAFFRYGLSLPVYLQGDIPGGFSRLLDRSWFRITGRRKDAAFILAVSTSAEGFTEVQLIDPDTERVYNSLITRFSPHKRADQVPLASELVAKLFNID